LSRAINFGVYDNPSPKYESQHTELNKQSLTNL